MMRSTCIVLPRLQAADDALTVTRPFHEVGRSAPADRFNSRGSLDFLGRDRQGWSRPS
jgi:hypothetical protein